MQLLQRINSALLKLVGWGTILSIAVIAVVIPYEVFGRYVLAKMSVWSGEVAIFSLVWATMLGSVIALKKGYQVGMLAVVEKVPPRAARLIQIAGFLFMLSFLSLMSYYGVGQTLDNYAQRSPAMQIPMSYPYAALPVGFLAMLLITAEDFLLFLRQGPPAKEEKA